MRFPSPRFLLAVALLTALARPVRADDLPKQLLFPVLPVVPSTPSPTEISLRVHHLPDSRRAESYRLAQWFRFGEHHALRLSVVAVSLKNSELVQYGGGPADLQWTWNLQGFGRRGVALDVLGVAPVGDPALHPLSARVPSLHLRGRASLWASSRGRAWIGWATRRVSPPEDRNQPLSSFPSGSGLEAGLELQGGDWSGSLVARHDLAGLPDHTWAEATVAWRAEARVGLLGGVTLDVGPRGNRLVDLGWRVGLRWFPPPAPATP